MHRVEEISQWLSSRNLGEINMILDMLAIAELTPEELFSEAFIKGSKKLEENLGHTQVLCRPFLKPEEQALLSKAIDLFDHGKRLANLEPGNREAEAKWLAKEVTPAFLHSLREILGRLRDLSLKFHPPVSPCHDSQRVSVGGIWDLPFFLLIDRIGKILVHEPYCIVGGTAVQIYMAAAQGGDASHRAVRQVCRPTHDVDIVLADAGAVHRLLASIEGDELQEKYVCEFQLTRTGAKRPIVHVAVYLTDSNMTFEQTINLNLSAHWTDAIGYTEQQYIDELATARSIDLKLGICSASVHVCTPQNIIFSKLHRAEEKDMYDVDVLVHAVHGVNWDEVWGDIPLEKRDKLIAWLSRRNIPHTTP